MWTKHNGVLRLNGNQCFVNCSRGRICGWNHCSHNADGRSHFDDAFFAVLAQNPHGAHSANRARHVHCGQRVLYNFIGDVAESGFFHGRARQGLGVFRGRLRAGFHDCIDLFLGKFREFLLCGGGSCRQFAGFLDGDEVAIAQAQNALPSPTNVADSIVRHGVQLRCGMNYLVILSEARNLSFFGWSQTEERFSRFAQNDKKCEGSIPQP